MSAVSPILKQTTLELQNLPSIAQFALGGGRFKRCKSVKV
jgi:hypothetical protein